MAKPKQDMFGMEPDANEEVSGDEGEGEGEGEDEESNDGDDYVIVNISPALGWFAAFGTSPEDIRILGLACFALVEIIPENLDQPSVPVRTVRPMVVDEQGEIEDVAAIETFLCVVPPGVDPGQFVNAAIARQAASK